MRTAIACRHQLAALVLGLAATTASPVRMNAAAQAASGCRDGVLSLVTTTGALEGTLQCPDGAGPWPLVLLVPGAGRVDRDGNSALQAERLNTMRLLADGLASRGIASVRYDKRGVGASAGAALAEADMRFVTYAQDAAEWVQQLQLDDRFTSLTVVGHGEGSLVGMLAARTADADGFVSLAGPGRRAADLMREQLGMRLPMELRADFRRVLAELEAGRTSDSIPYALTALLRPSAQAYLASWFRFDPSLEIGRLAVPVLIVQGSADQQVTVRDAQLLSAGQPRADAMILEGIDHSLRLAASDASTGMRTRTHDARRPVADAIIDGVAAFVAQVRRR
jgi:alpha-beta hydrolase superfamily lysophospholipase